jgi:hypothetical protein
MIPFNSFQEATKRQLQEGEKKMKILQQRQEDLKVINPIKNKTQKSVPHSNQLTITFTNRIN